VDFERIAYNEPRQIDVAQVWSARTRPRFESGDMSPHSKIHRNTYNSSVSSGHETAFDLARIRRVNGYDGARRNKL
jgi:hypothetical protein